MKKSAELITEEIQNASILVVDKNGLIGPYLCKEFESSANIVLVGERKSVHLKKGLVIPFKKRIPQIPNATYSFIYIVYSGEEETKRLLPHFIKKAQADEAKLFFICQKSFYGSELKDEVLDYGKASFIIIGDVFGEEILSDTVINRYFEQAHKTGRIEVDNMGMKHTYPIFIDDVIEGIQKISFGNMQSRLFLLYPSIAPTELSLSRMFHRIDPLIKVDFVEKKTSSLISVPMPAGEYIFSKEYPLQKRIKQVHESYMSKSQSKQANVVINEFVKKDTISFSFVQFVVIFFISFFILPVIVFFSVFIAGTAILAHSGNLAERGDINNAYKTSSISLFLFRASEKLSVPVFLELSLLGQQSSIDSLTFKLRGAQDIAMAEYFLLDAFKNIQKTMVGKSIAPEQDFDKGINSLKNALGIYQKIKAEHFLLSLNQPRLASLEKKLSSLDSVLKLISSGSDVAPTLMGFSKKSTLLVLFQNNMELRPGGGFIGSYGILQLDKGVIKDFAIHDVYEADGQLKGHVEPPFQIRRYLPSEHWFLRDSNFDIDFPTSASSAAYFLYQETGQRVDGVIGVDLSLLQKIIKVVEPLKVFDYDETITSDNMFLVIQKNVEKDFFPGSSQKKDFLTALFSSLKTALSSKNISYLSLAAALDEALKEKHIVFAFADPAVQEVFAVNKFSSELSDNKKKSPIIVNDFLGISEANLGVNKANYFVKREVHQDVFIEEKAIRSQVTLVYQNNSVDFPGGNYKNYLQVIVPLGSNLDSIEIDGVTQKIIPAVTDPAVFESTTFTPKSGLEVENVEKKGKTVFGFLVQVPQKSKQKIVISYILAQKIFLDQPVLTYINSLFKQPGASNDPFFFSLSYPAGLPAVERTCAFITALSTLLTASKKNNPKTVKTHEAICMFLLYTNAIVV